MTTNDNSTSPPWLQGQSGTDTTTEHDDSAAVPAHDDVTAAESTVDAEAAPEPGGHNGHDAAAEEERASGIFPPMPESIEHQFAPEQQFPPEQFGQEYQGPFAPPGGPPIGGFPPPYPPQGPGQFAPPGFPPPPGFPMHEPAGPFAPPPGFAEMPPQQHFGEMPPQNYGDPRQETPYGAARQEIGADGMVHRGFDEEHGSPAPEPQQFGQEQNSWAPPPPPMPPQPAYQPPPQQQPTGWHNPPSAPRLPQQPPPPPQQPGFPQQLGQPGHSVNDLNLLKRARRSPHSGWRRAVHKMSGGAINPGESSADVMYRELTDRVSQPVRGDYRIAILSLKGGVGKTTTTVGLGSTFASVRGDRVIAIDANPDLGTLAHRVPRQTRSTVRNLLEDQRITRYSDVRAHTSQAPSRLEVLASEQDPAVSEAFSEADYRRAISILQQFYNIILTDCGTGLMHSAMSGVLDMASSLILVTSPAIDGARSASATLDWLEHHGYNKLVERTVVVVNASRRGASTVDLDQLRKLFLDRTRAVQVVPFDDHLAEGAEIDLELVSKPTRMALLELAAMVADDFGYNLPDPFQGQQPQYPGQGHYPGPGPQGPYPGRGDQYPGPPDRYGP